MIMVTSETKCFTMGIRQLIAENNLPKIEFSAITEIDRPDFPKWDKLNAVTIPHQKIIRYFSDTKE